MIDLEIPESEKSLLKEIAKRYFVGYPIKFQKRFQGQSLAKHNHYLIGCRAGPSISILNLFHEMAHFSEREEFKILDKTQWNWDFYYGRSFGDFFIPESDKDVLREIKVWSFQYSIFKKFGIKDSPRQLVESMIFLGGFDYFKYDRCKERDPFEFASNMVLKLSEKEYSFEKFESNWFSRLEKLKR